MSFHYRPILKCITSTIHHCGALSLCFGLVYKSDSSFTPKELNSKEMTLSSMLKGSHLHSRGSRKMWQIN